jgi:predicted dehydrogenase
LAQIGIGVVGCGRNGANHARRWSLIDQAKVIGVCDVDEERAKEQADLHGVKAFTSVEDLVKEPGVDAIDVVTSGSHRDPAVMAAEAGKHVLVENPFANTVEEADDMIAASEKSGVVMMYAQTHRFYWAYVKAKELIDSGEIGDPISIVFTYFLQRLERNERWSRVRAQGGGFFVYEGTHFIDEMRWLMDSEIETVNAVGMSRLVAGGDGEDNGIAGFTFESGAFGAIHHGTADPGAGLFGWRLVGTKGMLDATGTEELRLGKGDWTSYRPPEGHDGFLIEFQEFLDSITEDRPPARTAYDGRATIAAAQAVIRSHEEGAPVRV